MSGKPAIGQTDPRVTRTRAHVLASTRALLGERGVAAVTYSEVAARARVTRQTLYRHWPTIDDLFIDLMLADVQREMPPGGTRRDVARAFLVRLNAAMDDPANAGVLTALIARADHAESTAKALRAFIDRVRSTLAAALGEPKLDPEQYAVLVGPVVFQRFLARRPVTRKFIDRLVDGW